MEESGGTIHALVEERLKLVSWAQNMDTTKELGLELRQNAMNFRDTDGIMRRAREFNREFDPDYMSENEKKRKPGLKYRLRTLLRKLTPLEEVLGLKLRKGWASKQRQGRN